MVTKQPYVIYIYIYIYIGKTMKFNRFLECYLHSVLLFWHPTHKPKKQPYGSTNHGPLLNCFFYCFFRFVVCLFFCFGLWVGCESKRAKNWQHCKNCLCFFDVFEIFAQHFKNPMEKKTTNQWRSMKGRPMSTSTQPHLTDIIQVCMFCWFAHRLGMPYATIVLSEIWHS